MTRDRKRLMIMAWIATIPTYRLVGPGRSGPDVMIIAAREGSLFESRFLPCLGALGPP